MTQTFDVMSLRPTTDLNWYGTLIVVQHII